MLLTRKIGAVLRGKATPLQVLLATTLGGLLGFVPGFFLPGDIGGGFAQAPGLILLLLSCTLVLNANLAVFGLTTLAAKLLSFVLLPVSYRVGGFLLDGPLSGLFAALINGKVTAWFGFQYYATTGGLVLGAAFGVGCGLLLNRTVRFIRNYMSTVEESSEGYQKYAKRWWVRLATWLFLGKGKGKKSWRELAESSKVGMPIRITGVLAAVVFGVSVWVFQSWFSTPILTRNVQSALTAMNGATVDLQAAQVDFSAGTMQLKALAIADAKALDHDLFAADAVVATIDTGELLRRRFVIDEVRATNARSNSQRTVPGVIPPTIEPPPPPPAPPAGTKTIDDYVQDFEVWKQRFEQASRWIERIAGGDDAPAAEPTPEQREADKQQQELAGLAQVVATHLIEPTPRVVIRRIDVQGIGYSYNGKLDKLDLLAQNLSDAPSLLSDVLSLSVRSQADTMRLQLTGRSKQSDQLGLAFDLKQVAVDSVFGQLRIAGAPPLRGGTMDLSLSAMLDRVAGQGLSLDAPLQVKLQDTTFAFAGSKPTKVDSLLLPIGLRGPMTRPQVSIDDKVLQQALLAAGQQELANFVQSQAGKLIGDLPSQLQGVIDPNKPPAQIVDELKQKAEAERLRLEAEAKKKAEEAAKKLLPGGLQGLIPGGKKN